MPGGNDCCQQSVIMEMPTDLHPSVGTVASILADKKLPLGGNNTNSNKATFEKVFSQVGGTLTKGVY